MPEITGVKERRGRARVSVDGEPWAELDAGIAIERGLREGAAFSWEDLAELRKAGERPLAMTRALNLLGYRARSEGEVRERLGRHGYATETVEAVIARLGELGYLDDEEFARQRAQEKAKKYGPRRVSADLMNSGVGRDLASRAVAEEFEGRSELADARSAASRRYNGGGSEAEARRVYGFLARRGYSAGVCAEVAREHRGPAQS
ncbi:MAG: RecX [uncultured Rubrobacteraceae bacterium]|uniref:Regulatory protein RecX n=1 Tax=uncultured Rubrobacteraceae bacterium TaxID=349277 RepID=A0A6J4PWL3_9ACTN|nr:MAG: RecX [uncultured Rubrobacteraceae bacterium]